MINLQLMMAVQKTFINPFSNELSPVLLGSYDSWGTLCTIGVTSRTGITSSIHKKGKKILEKK